MNNLSEKQVFIYLEDHHRIISKTMSLQMEIKTLEEQKG